MMREATDRKKVFTIVIPDKKLFQNNQWLLQY